MHLLTQQWGGGTRVGHIRRLPVQVEYTENGEYSVDASEYNVDGLSKVEVSVNTPVVNVQDSKSVEYTENGEYSVVPDTGFDAIAQVNVTVDVPAAGGAGWITQLADKEYDSIGAAEELNMMDVKGALFSWNASTGKYHVWNADEVKVWDWDLDRSSHLTPAESPALPSWDEDVEFPTNEYGEVIAVCAGKGMWVSTKWESGTPRKWCEQSSPLFSFQWDCFDLSGAEVAKKLYAADKDLTGSIFADVKVFEGITGDVTVGHWFVPSRSEIFQTICACADEVEDATSSPYYTYANAYYNATHIIAQSEFWSCSQDVINPNYACTLADASGLGSSYKSREYPCVVCLRFGESLIPAA